MSHVQQSGQVTSQPVQQMCTQLVVSLMWHCHMDAVCPDTRYEEKLQEKRAQHKALEEALKEYGYNVTTLPIIIGQSRSQYTTSDALAKIGVEHGLASKVMSKLHEHSVLTFHKILTSRRVLEREKSDKSRQNRPDPP